MATRFEVVVMGRNEAYARAAGEEALAEIRRVEGQLSWFDPASLLSRINRDAASGPVVVHAPVFGLLQRIKQLHGVTDGAFDPTIIPDEDGLPETGRTGAGMAGMVLDIENRTISFTRSDIALNLGGIGKGYAIDEAATILREAGVENALIQGGTSTAYALGRDDDRPWRIALSHPSPDRAGQQVAWVELENAALSISGIYGRGRRLADGEWVGHVIDPRTGNAVRDTELAAVVVDSDRGALRALDPRAKQSTDSAAAQSERSYPSTDSDALSTALLVLGSHSAAPNAFPDCRTLCFSKDKVTDQFGPWHIGALAARKEENGP
jgi:FAD:protein FMN transferase